MTSSTSPSIIGICGYPTHGKSTVQGFLELIGVEARDDAEIMRRRVMKEYDLTWEDVTTQEGKLKVVPGINGEMMTVRKLLGDYGQIFGEQVHGPLYWVEQAIEKLREDSVEHPVSFGSLRRSQGQAVKNSGGFMIEVLDPRKPFSEHYFDQFDRDLVDVIIMNDGNLSDLAFATYVAIRDMIPLTFDQIKPLAQKF